MKHSNSHEAARPLTGLFNIRIRSSSSLRQSQVRSVLLAGIGVVLALAAVYGVGVLYFSTHFGLNTTIDGRNVTFLSVDEAEERIGLNADKFDMLVTGREGLELTMQADDVGLFYVPDGQVRAVFRTQNPLLWPLRLTRQIEYNTTPSFGYNPTKLGQFLQASEIFAEEGMRAPVDAYPVFEGNSWVIKAEDPGTTLDQQATYKAIADSLVAGQAHCDLDQSECYLRPGISALDPSLVDQIAEFNTYAPFQITYLFGDASETLDAYTAMDWFYDNPDGSKSLDTDAMEAWLSDFCSRHNTIGSERTFQTARGDTISIGGGSFGWQIDKTAERNAIFAAIANQSSETREPYYIQRAVVHPTQPGQPDWGNTYIEVDQSIQKLFYYVDGVLVLETDVVTGLPTAKRSTPTGVYFVYVKLSPTRLKGPLMPNGEPEWDSFVNYWMAVTYSGVGIHDASWQPWFGGNRYTYGGSHGCINLPFSRAQELYRMVEMDTPVIIHW